ncbi:LysR family transcriptional regulator [Candidimonas sp. SYP-B2681]|uniref:LysR family transcriptional regulator n=1 Tax=Candidimonas sp. SYP-B2681 TaxID=2497686 RepID=UPI000F881132|nr:LysR family transcriptional regulator [Candidimonas sp. SYP-B2681]RTZ48221.1 LysR family transcriptional regulator [Candidimonas sp. SYP-B2681]
MNVLPKHLRAFVHLAETLSFSRTAEHFHYTQPSLSKLIKDLETTLGRSLFERSTRHVALTEDGVELVGQARHIIRSYDEGLSGLENRIVNSSQRIAISALPSLASVMLPAVVSHLEGRYPSLTTTIYDGSSEATLQHLLRNQVDLALTAADPSRRELVYQELLKDRFVLVSAGKLAASIPTTVTLSDLSDMPLISMSAASTAQKYMVAAFMSKDTQFRPKMAFDQISTIGSFVQAGLGIAVLPYLAVFLLRHLEQLTITEIVGGPTRSIGIVTRRDTQLSLIAEEACEQLKRYAQEIVDKEPKWLRKAS